MHIATDRFGTLDLAPEAVIRFPSGIIGFPAETELVLLPHGDSPFIAWLQSAKTPAFALPVVSAHGIGIGYPDVPLADITRRAGLGENPDDVAVMVVLCAQKGLPPTVNLLAPIVVNSTTRTGAQVVLEGSRYTTRELFMLSVPPAPRQERTASL